MEGSGGAWSFGGFKAVVKNCRRDLDDFRTAVIDEAASFRGTLTSFPDAFDRGIGAAANSFVAIGQAIDDAGAAAWRLTLDLKKAIMEDDDDSTPPPPPVVVDRELLVRRLASSENEEELSWEVDEDEVVCEELKGQVVIVEAKRLSCSSGDSDLTVVSSVPSAIDFDDISWDEIEIGDDRIDSKTKPVTLEEVEDLDLK